MRLSLTTLAIASALPASFAAPTPAPEQLPRGLIDGLLSTVINLVGDVLGGLNSLDSVVPVGHRNAFLSSLDHVKPTTRPTNIDDAIAREGSIWRSSNTDADFYVAVTKQVGSGLVDDASLGKALNGGPPVGEDSTSNNNPRPSKRIYPRIGQDDTVYTIPEDALRQAIFIPKDFTYGAKPPVIFVTATGTYGGSVFGHNLRKQLAGREFADPVWLNIPASSTNEHKNSEFIAYAINYISTVSGNCKKINVISWSHGGHDTQQVFKKWPSTRKVVKDFIQVSPDFHITAHGGRQQDHSDDDHSAYVPTTTIFSGFADPTTHKQSSSLGYTPLDNAHHVGTYDIDVQHQCAGHRAGSFYGFSGILFHPLTFALIVDVLTHDGPGDLARIDLANVCNRSASFGLDLGDIIATIGLIPIAAIAALGLL